MSEWKSPLLNSRVKHGTVINNAVTYALDIVRSESARVDGQLTDDFGCFLTGNCFYLPGFSCDGEDQSIYRQMKSEIAASANAGEGLAAWSKHQVVEQPEVRSGTFNQVVAMLSEYFDVDVHAVRLNYYSNGSQWKPFHHDSHAYGSKALKEDFTMGVSFGATRCLSWLHPPSNRSFSIPQRNGDCFAFTSEVNSRFMHGVPRRDECLEDRMSVIVWGRRNSLNERNGGERQWASAMECVSMDDAVLMAHQLVKAEKKEQPVEISTGIKVKKKNRLQ